MARNITLGEALWQGLTKRSPKDPTISGLVADVLKLGGSPVKAASLAGVTPATFKKWMSKKSRPSKKSLGKLSAARRRGQLRPGRVKRLKRLNGLTISGLTLYDMRERDFRLSLHIKSGTVGKIIDAYFLGDMRGMEDALVKGIHESWYYGLFSQFVYHSRHPEEETGDALVDAGIEVYGATYG